jgi:hypothetical protein
VYLIFDGLQARMKRRKAAAAPAGVLTEAPESH